MLKTFLSKMCEKISFKNIKEFRFKKYTKLFSILLILIIVGLVLPGGLAYAGILGDAVMGVIYFVIYVVFMILFNVAYVVAWIGAEILNMSLNPAIMNQVFSNPGIAKGWSLIRDICNLLFLLLLLLVAFGTIVQSQKYNIKNSLLKLILAIFLINFSNVIAGAIIDFGNILMYGILGFMCPVANTCFQDLTKPLMEVIDGFWNKYTWANQAITGVGPDAAIGLAVATVYTFMYGFILLAMAAFLLVRTAGLAILLILAPFAYFGEVMPGMEKVASKWWNNIWSYTLFGPIFALMLYISGDLATTPVSAIVKTNPNLGTFGEIMSTIIINIIPLLFLLAIVPVTKELGLAGTDTILKNTTGLGEKIGAFAGSAASDTWGRYVARGAGMQGQQGPGAKAWLSRRYAGVRRIGSNFSPTAIKQAYKAKQANDAHDYDVATGRVRNKMEAVSDPYGAAKDKYKRMTDKDYKSTRRDYQKEAEKRKSMEAWKAEGVDTSDDAIDSVQRGKKIGESEESLSIKVKFIAAEGGIGDMLERSVDAGGKKYGKGAAGLKRYVDDTFSSFSKEEKSKLYSNIAKSETSKNGNTAYEGLGKSGYNAKLGRTEYTVNNMSNATEIKDQEDDQVKAANKKDPKDLKKDSFLDTNDEITSAGERTLADMKGDRAKRIGMMDRDRAVALDKALKKKYVSVVFCKGSNPDLGNAWDDLKTKHGL